MDPVKTEPQSKENVPVDLDEFPSVYNENEEGRIPTTVFTTPYDDLSTIENDTIGHTVHPWDFDDSQGPPSQYASRRSRRPHPQLSEEEKKRYAEKLDEGVYSAYGYAGSLPHSKLPPQLLEVDNETPTTTSPTYVQHYSESDSRRDDRSKDREDKKRWKCYYLVAAIVGPIVSAIVVGVTIALILTRDDTQTQGTQLVASLPPATTPTLSPSNSPIVTEPSSATTQPPTTSETSSPIQSTTSPPLPTESPGTSSVSPVESPTLASVSPTESPVSPTINPTENPTKRPTERPSLQPTLRPSLRPTVSPTSKPTIQPTPRPTERPTEAPIDIPTPAEEAFDQTLSNFASGSLTLAQTVGTPQYLARQWVTDDPDFFSFSAARMVQRYALAVFAFGLDRAPASADPGRAWLTYGSSECDWYASGDGATCNVFGQIQRLDLRDHEQDFGYTLQGRLPTELSLLSNSLEQVYLQDQGLDGTLPSEFGDLARLTRLQLTDNNLTGTLPPEIGRLGNLSVLGLGRNGLTGTFPREWTELANLSTLGIERNSLGGQLPPQIANLVSLTGLFLDGNEFTGTVPTAIWRIDGLEHVNLGDNNFLGTISSQACSLESLRILSADCNNKVICECCTRCTD